MNLITAEHLTHSYTERKLFDDVSFSLNEQEKVGIIGINGTGKSTLLKILAGKEVPDKGTIVMGRNLRLGYLPQNPVFSPEFDVLTASLPLAEDISGHPMDYESQARTMLTKLGIDNFNQNITELSGGQRKRIALVRTLLTPSDILILDEPTNHLDSAMAEWLENHLKHTKNALIMITHDRYFLDSIVNRIVEIDKGKLYSYSCNYLGYLERKAQREEIELATERKRQSILKVELAWMMRGARARSTKQKAHIARYEALRDMAAPIQDSTVEISSVSSRLGRTTVELEHICKTYDNHVLINDFTYYFLRNDRIGIIGPNGCGKSTLMKIIMGQVTPDSGTVVIGQTVKIGYFSQENEALDESLRVIDYVREGGEFIKTADGSSITASAMLERFLFPGEVQYSRIEKLSGGEKRRLYLLRILMEAPNVLFLDEPTNDLDIATLTILEDYLDSFDGIVVTVSHDRYFLDRIAKRIFAYEENGHLVQYEGGYTDYLKSCQKKHPGGEDFSGSNLRQTDIVQDDSQNRPNRNNWKNDQKKKKKMTYQEKKDFETIEADIAELEEKIEELEHQILQSASDYVKLNQLTLDKTALEATLEEKMNRWMYLEELADELGMTKE
ncbi:MAG: ABC-F family ATP-binding cassette domain-containing protein [Lachnospiraceae bacterium]|nr:ABC-F family ATP-binding cassette domain-containing protein [Lachnospiraceae bacterium]